ncbi:MAG: GPP34 family phosphoprotein [Bacteroidales bacterium]|jgi:hypothetical protein|nr:GPP34 family phosphoprotein [Bacteroidales bacterium]
MEPLKIKDLLILLIIHPQNGRVRSRNIADSVLVAAALIDLVLLGCLRINNGKIEATGNDTGDPVLNNLLEMFVKNNGKSFHWMVNRLSKSRIKIYRMQLEHLIKIRIITAEQAYFLGMTLFNRYRLTRSDSLKPVFIALERVLIYGRKPNLELRLLIEFLRMTNVIKSFYPGQEYKMIAKKRSYELSKIKFEVYNESFQIIFKTFKRIIRMNQFSENLHFNIITH